MLTQAAIIVATIIVTRLPLVPETMLWANAVDNYLCAFGGGLVVGAMARHRGTLHGGLLAVVIVLLGLALGAESSRAQPRWYAAAVTFGSALSAVTGGFICSRLRRTYSSGHYRGPKR